MPPGEQFLYAETITAMKKAMARQDDASDSDTSIHHTTNRGNKLKRKAKHVQQGRLHQADGPRVYRRILHYNGYERPIISRNPRRVDADGDSMDEETDSNLDLTDSEDDPYSDTRIEQILMPLLSASGLDKHPALSQPYKMRVLDEMIDNAQETVRKEQESLYHIKQLMVRFRGDHNFVPIGNIQTGQDILTINPMSSSAAGSVTSKEDLHAGAGRVVDWDPTGATKPGGTDHEVAQTTEPEDRERTIDHEMQGDVLHDAYQHAGVDEAEPLASGLVRTDPEQKSADESFLNEDAGRTDGVQDHHTNGDTSMVDDQVHGDGERSNGHGEDEDEEKPAHRMTTRAKAQAEVDGSTTSRAGSPAETTPSVHPFFVNSVSSLPAAPPSTTELMRLLAQYVQKQEEVVRQSLSLLYGLQKALRLRQMIWSWCRAEGHAGEMSDGEDWYDMEEWGLQEPLKKGLDEEDEELVSSKNTRNRGRGTRIAGGGAG